MTTDLAAFVARVRAGRSASAGSPHAGLRAIAEAVLWNSGQLTDDDLRGLVEFARLARQSHVTAAELFDTSAEGTP
jgi:hypothetical protein